jgi:hypothetical protein
MVNLLGEDLLNRLGDELKDWDGLLQLSLFCKKIKKKFKKEKNSCIWEGLLQLSLFCKKKNIQERKEFM